MSRYYAHIILRKKKLLPAHITRKVNKMQKMSHTKSKPTKMNTSFDLQESRLFRFLHIYCSAHYHGTHAQIAMYHPTPIH